MGRAKLNLDLITKDKHRLSTYKNRKASLFKKLKEFTILCDVKACMIVYGPKNPNSNSDPAPEIWPADSSAVMDLIREYRDNKQGTRDDPRGCVAGGVIRRTTNLADFFNDRTKKLHADIVRLRRKTAQKRFPTSDEELKGFSVSQLRQLVGVFDDKLREVGMTMEHLKAAQRQPPLISLYGNNEIATTNNNSSMMELMLAPSPRRMMAPVDMTFQNHKFLENTCNVDDQRSFFEYAGDYENYGCDDMKNAVMEQRLIPWDTQYQTPMPLSSTPNMLVPMNGQLQYHQQQQQQLEPEPHVLAQLMLRNGSPMFGSAYGVGYGATLTVPNAQFKATAQPQYSWNPLGMLNYNFGPNCL